MVTLRDEIEEEVARRYNLTAEDVKEIMDLNLQYIREEVIQKQENVCFIRFLGLGTLVNSFDLNKQAILMTSSHRKESLRRRIDYMCEYRDYSRVFAVPLIYAVSFFQLGETTFTNLYKTYYNIIEKLAYAQNKRMAKYFKGNT